MTIDHPIRHFLSRVCSDDTMARVVDPILADVRWERGSAWLACLVLARALALHTVISIPAVLNRAWSDDERAIPKAAAFAVTGAIVGAMPLVAPHFFERYYFANREASVVLIALFLAPQALAMTLPAALLLAIPLAFRRQDPSPRLTRRTLLLSLCFVLMTFAVIAWAVPEGNQAFRVLASGKQLERGPGEQGLAFPREQIEVLKLRYGGLVKARTLEFDYHGRLMLICLPFPLAILALAISRSLRGRRRPWAMGLAAMGGYVFGFFPLLIGCRLLMRASSLPPALFAWTPMLLLAIVALRAYSSTPALSDSSAVS
jgi:hypothetical protein